ncbi:hypothetical protein O1L44_31820 [Streptomyces noursei]|nr:hypothetical protein [Streptomyces noursei]
MSGASRRRAAAVARGPLPHLHTHRRRPGLPWPPLLRAGSAAPRWRPRACLPEDRRPASDVARCGVRRARATAVRPGTRLARLPAAVLVTQRAAAHEAARRSLWIRVLLHIAVAQLVLVFLALVVYLGRHAGT